MGKKRRLISVETNQTKKKKQENIERADVASRDTKKGKRKVSRVGEILRLSTCPGTSKWP